MPTETARSFVADGGTLRAFETGGNNTDIVFGVNVQGTRAGVYGESVPGSDGAGRDSDIDGVGVCGKGSRVGVYGQGNHGDVGVLGTHTNGRLGVVGAVMRGGAGVVGVSVDSLGNAAELVQNLSVVDGTGVFGVSGQQSPRSLNPSAVLGSSADQTGIAGTSGTNAGVLGVSQTGDGGTFSSLEGDGINAQSGEGRGAVLASASIAQLRLMPADSGFGQLALPAGETGDLYVRNIPNTPAPKNRAEIFFCLGKNSEGNSLWVPLAFGTAVLGA
jgi:hypothetical protein